MKIEIRGVIQSYDGGHKYLDVVVAEGGPYVTRTKRLGIDIVANRGRIITTLAGLYGISPGQIVWPEHIIMKEGDD